MATGRRQPTQAEGLIFAIDRTAFGSWSLLDATRRPSSRRWIWPATRITCAGWRPVGELWVTQPDKDRIEIFQLWPASGPAVPVHKEFLPFPEVRNRWSSMRRTAGPIASVEEHHPGDRPQGPRDRRPLAERLHRLGAHRPDAERGPCSPAWRRARRWSSTVNKNGPFFRP